MTITYTGHVSNARLSAFSRLLFYWKGSIYKLMYKEMLIFCALYAILSVIYRVLLIDEQRRMFEKLALYCETFTNLIPLSFVLGFYVSLVVTRWWSQYLCIPWPDRVMLYVTTMIDGTDETARLTRRTLMRYLTLGSLIVFQATSVRIKKRFPTMEHLVEAGIVTRTEVKMLEDISTPHGKWWIPFVWCCNLVKEARRQCRIADSYCMKAIIDEILSYRGNLGMCYAYDWISIPLVYTQVTTLAVYTFFIGCLFGRQFLDPNQDYEGHNIDLYIPFFTLLQFFFYMGWLKVAEQLINPFGEDDDDFEMNWIIDRNMQVSLLTADDLHGQVPPLEKDLYFGEPPPDYLPYTKSSIKGMSQPHMGSTADLRISDEGMKVLCPLETIQEDVHEDVVVGNCSHMPNITSAYLSTPRRCGAVSSTTASPKYYRHLGCSSGTNNGLLLSQNLMYGMRSPVDVRSRTSLHSRSSVRDDVTDPDVVSHQQIPCSLPTRSSSVVGKVTEKLGRWLAHHSSRSDLSASLNIGLHGGGRSQGHGHAGFSSSSFMSASRQTSTSDDFAFGGSTLDPLPGAVRHAVTTSPSVPSTSSAVGPAAVRSSHLPPLAELFSPQSMFASDFESDTLVAEFSPSSPPIDDVIDTVAVDLSPSLNGGDGDGGWRTGGPSTVIADSTRTVTSSSTMNSRVFSVERAADDISASATHHYDTPRRSLLEVSRTSNSRLADAGRRVEDHKCLEEPNDAAASQEASRKRSSIDGCCTEDRLTSSRTRRLKPPAEVPPERCPTIGVIDADGRLFDPSTASSSTSSVIDRDRHKSRTSSSSSRGSSDMYERPESNQCTVTSLTPLLPQDDVDDVADIEPGDDQHQ